MWERTACCLSWFSTQYFLCALSWQIHTQLTVALSRERSITFLQKMTEHGRCRKKKGRMIGAASTCLQPQWNLRESWKDQGMLESRSIPQSQTWQEEGDFTQDQKWLMQDLLQLCRQLKNSGQRSWQDESTGPNWTQCAKRDLFKLFYPTDLSFLWLKVYFVQG